MVIIAIISLLSVTGLVFVIIALMGVNHELKALKEITEKLGRNPVNEKSTQRLAWAFSHSRKAIMPMPPNVADYPTLFDSDERFIETSRNCMYVDACLMIQSNGVSNTNALRVELWRIQMPITGKDLDLLMRYMDKEGLIVYNVR